MIVEKEEKKLRKTPLFDILPQVISLTREVKGHR